MNVLEIQRLLAIAGLNSGLQNTGHPDYQRLFVKTKDGCSLGRITIHRGHYSHVKWYCPPEGAISGYDYWMFGWSYTLSTGKHLERALYDQLCEKAKAQHQADLEAKRAWRRANPKPNGKQRGRLTGRSEVSFLSILLREHIEAHTA